MHGPAILACRWMQLAVGTDQITAGCRVLIFGGVAVVLLLLRRIEF